MVHVALVREDVLDHAIWTVLVVPFVSGPIIVTITHWNCNKLRFWLRRSRMQSLTRCISGSHSLSLSPSSDGAGGHPGGGPGGAGGGPCGPKGT